MTTTGVDAAAEADSARPGFAALEPARIQLVLFDLDGTLVDSVGDLAWCGNEMLKRLDLPPRDETSVRNWVGNGVERLIKRMQTGEMEAEPPLPQYEQGLAIFRELYAEHASDRSRLYPGVLESLQQLSAPGRGLKLACVTNKDEPYTSRLIAEMGLESFFQLVVAGNTTPRKKPDPMQLHYAADHFGFDYGNCLMVGDSSNDVSAARAAGFAVVGVPYGYNHGRDIAEANPDLVVDNLLELVKLFD